VDLGKFNPDDFETHETALLTCWHKCMGCKAKILSIAIMRNVIIPVEFVDDAKRHMYQ
jgi:hypothetical protein